MPSQENNDFFYKELKDVLPEVADTVYSEKNIDLPILCEAPKNYGLQNSERIIPHYYISEKKLLGKLFECDFLFTIVDSIRNMRALNTYQIHYLKTINKEESYQLLIEYNNVMEVFIEHMLDETT